MLRKWHLFFATRFGNCNLYHRSLWFSLLGFQLRPQAFWGLLLHLPSTGPYQDHVWGGDQYEKRDILWFLWKLISSTWWDHCTMLQKVNQVTETLISHLFPLVELVMTDWCFHYGRASSFESYWSAIMKIKRSQAPTKSQITLLASM